MTELERLLVRARELTGGKGVYVKRRYSPRGVMVEFESDAGTRRGVGATTEEALRVALGDCL